MASSSSSLNEFKTSGGDETIIGAHDDAAAADAAALMQTTPTVNECVGYLEKNPAARQIIGLLMECDQKKCVTQQQQPPPRKKKKPSDDDNVSVSLTDPVTAYVKRIDAPPVDWRDLAKGHEDDLGENDFKTSTLKGSDDDVGEEVIKTPSSHFPSLYELAFNTVSAQLQNDSKEIERKYKNTLATLLDKTGSTIKNIILEHQAKLRKSPEAVMVDLVCSLLARAKEKLKTRLNQEHQAVKAGRDQVVNDTKKKVTETKHIWFAERQSILNDHVSFLKEHSSHLLPDVARNTLCISPDCRNLFDPEQLPVEERCLVADCMSASSNCGCRITVCRLCERGVCEDHATSHETTFCPQRESHMCGYDPVTKTVRTDESFCNGQFVHLGECEECSVKICADCVNICSNSCGQARCVECSVYHFCSYSG